MRMFHNKCKKKFFSREILESKFPQKTAFRHNYGFFAQRVTKQMALYYLPYCYKMYFVLDHFQQLQLE